MQSRSWTEEQMRLIEVDDNGMPRIARVAVLADAGSGKTSVLVARVRAILAKRKERVLCVSFTERSAADLKSRLSDQLGAEVYTIHGFCARVLREHGALLGLPPLWRVLDEKETVDMLYSSFEKVYRRAPPTGAELSADQWFSLTRTCAGARHKVTNELQYETPDAETFVTAVLSDFDASKQGRGALEYGDLETQANQLLADPSVQALYRRRYAHVFVDEFQDTSEVQCALVQRLAGPQQTFFVVGDSKQSIYRFRGADVAVFEKFVGTLPETHRLSRNFRSRAAIIDTVNAVCRDVIAHYGDMTTSIEDKQNPAARALGAGVMRVESSQHAKLLASCLRALRDAGISESQCVLLLPRLRGGGNPALMAALQAEGIAVAMGSAGGVLSNPSLQALLRLWVWACEPWQKLRAAEVISQFQGKRNALLADLQALAPPTGRLSSTELLRALDEEYDLSTRLGMAFRQFKSFILSYQEQGLSAPAVARRLSRLLVEGVDVGGLTLLPPPDDVAGALKVLTVHGSKGLEFPVVFLADLEGRKFRHADPFLVQGGYVYVGGRDEKGKLTRSDAQKNAIENERQADIAESSRLLYVAMTRAKDALIMVDDEPPAELAKKSLKKPQTWASWIRTAVPKTAPGFEFKTKTEAPQYVAPLTERAVVLPPVSYQPSRYGVTAYIKKDTIAYKPAKKSFSSKLSGAELGTLVHECLEQLNWKVLKALEAEHGLDLSKFWQWLLTPEGRICFPRDPDDFNCGAELSREFAFEQLLPSGEVLAGRIDLLVTWPKERKAWVIDYKLLTTPRRAEDFNAQYAPQMKIYGNAVQELLGYDHVQTYLVDISGASAAIWHCLLG